MAQKYCTICGEVAQTKTETKGTMGIELLLWIMFIVPGIFYSIWRLTSRHEACGVCGASGPIPVTSPIAKKALAS